MNKSIEYKISVVLFSLSLILCFISMVMGLIPGLCFSIDKICMYLGFSFLCFGLLIFEKSEENNDKREK